MKRRIFAFCMLLALALLLTFSAFARSGVSGQPLLVDEAELLSPEEAEALNERLATLSAQHEMDIVLLTTLSLDGKNERDYADDFYDENGYAHDGVLLLFFTGEERGVWMSTSGSCMDIFSVSGMNDIFEEIISYLSDGSYADAFDLYLDLVDQSISDDFVPDDSNDSYDDSTDDSSFHFVFSPLQLLICIGIGALLALIPVCIMRAKLRTVQPKHSAENYVREGSFQLTRERDLYLYHTVTSVARPKDNDNGSHTSSSGASHGGAGSRF